MPAPGGLANGARRIIIESFPYLLAYASWLIAGALLTLPLLYAPPAAASILHKLEATRWAISAVQRFSYVFLGLGWLIAMLIAEHHLRTSVPKGRLRGVLRRLAVRIGITVAITALLYFLPAFM